MKKIMMLLLTSVLICGCGNKSVCLTPVNVQKNIEIKDISKQSLLSYNQFVSNLLKESYREDNTLISPLSLTYALAMSASGAEGETLHQITALFGLNLDEMDAYLSNIRNAKGLHVANSIWLRDEESLQVKEDFLDKCSEVYQAEAYKAMFDQHTVKEMNQWVSEHTNHMIPKIIEQLNQDDMMCLLNALSFDEKWQVPYEEDQMSENIFYSQNGTNSTVSFMGEFVDQYIENDEVIGISKAYKESNFEFIAIMPKNDFSEYIQTLTGEKLTQFTKDKKEKRAQVKIPKFKIENTFDFSSILQEMGMQDAFDSELARFEKMGTLDHFNLYLQKVLQKTSFDFNAEGVKASSATSIILEASAPRPDDDLVYINFDHPFIYMILDKNTQTPIFIGTVNNL